MAIVDSGIHIDWAMEIARGNLLGNVPFFRAPLYIFFLSLFHLPFWDTHTTFIVIRLAQFFIGSISCVILFLIGALIYNKKVGFLSGLIASFYWVFIYFEGEFLIPVILIFLILCGFLFLIEAVVSKKKTSLFLSGLFFGLSAISRPNILLFFPVVLIWLYIQYKKDMDLKKVFLKCSLFAAAMLIPILPITLINYVVAHDIILISSQAGINFYIGNNAKSDGRSASIVSGARSSWLGRYQDTIKIAERKSGRKLKQSEVSRFWFKRGIYFFIEQPKKALRLYAAKIAYLIDYFEIANNKNIYFFANFNGFINWPIFISYWMLFPFAFAGAIWNKRDRFYWLFIGFILSYSFSIILFFVCARFRLPMIPFYILLASEFIIDKMELLRQKKLRLLRPELITFFIVFIYFSSIAFTKKPFAANSLESPSTGLYKMGTLYYLKGEYEEAENAFKRLTDWYPPYNAYAHYGLGCVYFNQSHFQKALWHLKKAIQLQKELRLDIEDFLNRKGNRGKFLINKL